MLFGRSSASNVSPLESVPKYAPGCGPGFELPEPMMVMVNVVWPVMVAVAESCPVTVTVYVPAGGSVLELLPQSAALVSRVSWVVMGVVPVTETDPLPFDRELVNL